MKQRTLNWMPALTTNWLLVATAVCYAVLDRRDPESESIGLLVLGVVVILLAILALVLTTIVHHRCWLLLPEPHRKTSPGKAVGFMFIPLFNLYWVFPSFVGLATMWESASPRPVTGLKATAIAFAIAFILCIIPNTMLPEIVMLVLWTSLVGRINAIAGQMDQRTDGEQSPPAYPEGRADAPSGSAEA